MRTRISAVGIAMLATVGLALTGCGPRASAGNGSTPSPSPSLAAPKDALVDSVKKLGQNSYAFDLKQTNASGQGKVDPANKAAQVQADASSSNGSFKVSVVVVGADYWIKMDLGSDLDKLAKIDPTTWMHIDVSKVTKKDSLPVDPSSVDLLDFSTMSDSLVNVQRTDATHYTGTIDLTTVKGAAELDQDTVKKLGDKAKSVPFTATLDDQGRLTEFKIDGSSIDPEASIDMTFSDYGADQNITKPTGTVKEAPSSVYDIFNS